MAGMLGVGPAHRWSGTRVTVCARAQHASRGGSSGRGLPTSEQVLQVSKACLGRPKAHGPPAFTAEQSFVTIYLAPGLNKSCVFVCFTVGDFVNIPRHWNLCGLRCGSVEGDPAWPGRCGALRAQRVEAADGRTFDQTGVVVAPGGQKGPAGLILCFLPPHPPPPRCCVLTVRMCTRL